MNRFWRNKKIWGTRDGQIGKKEMKKKNQRDEEEGIFSF